MVPKTIGSEISAITSFSGKCAGFDINSSSLPYWLIDLRP